MTVDDVTLTWNDAADLAGNVVGIRTHDDPTDCSILSSTISLGQGQGFSLQVIEALQNCTDFPDCSQTTCTSNNDCGTDCRCQFLAVPPFGLTGFCVPDFDSGTVPNASRVTVTLEIDDGDNGDDPIVEGYDVMVFDDQTAPQVKGFREAVVEEH